MTIVDAVYGDASDARMSSSTNGTETLSPPNAEACVLSVNCSRRVEVLGARGDLQFNFW